MKLMNKLFICFMLVTVYGCNTQHSQYKKVPLRYGDSIITERQINQQIDVFVTAKKLSLAYRFIDSLLYLNKGSGFLFYNRGFIKSLDFKWDSALSDFKIAKKLKYKSERCNRMIDFCNTMIHDTRK